MAGLMHAVRKVRDGVRRFGLDFRTLRGRDQWRAGLQVAWHPTDERTERVFISTVEGFGASARFLVRNHNDYIQSFHLAGKFFDEDELAIIQEYYRGGTFLDIGANVGNHAIFAAIVLGAPKVIACEPYPEAYRILRCNIALNDLGDVVEHVPYGIAETSGRGSLEGNVESLGLTKVLLSSSGELELRSGDELLGGEPVGFIKIDVEGLEMQVLSGLRETIARCRPVMLVEVDEANIPAFETLCNEWSYRIMRRFKVYRENTYFLIMP